MRCRFCSKSIPLLRRLSDAQFCSDAHRDAYGDEQKLAFERLMTTQGVGKTQKLPAYNQAAEIPQGRPPTQTMVAAGGFVAYYLDTPLPFGSGASQTEPLATNLTVYFCEHAVAFPARFRQSGRLARVPVRPGRGTLKALADAEFLAECRASYPRAATRPIHWEYTTPVADTDPALITRLWPVSFAPKDTLIRAAAPELLWLAQGIHCIPRLQARAAALYLRPIRTLSEIAAPSVIPADAAEWPLEMLSAWSLILSYPSGRQLRAIAEVIPLAPVSAPAEELNALFEAFATQPLATSRHLPALAAAVLRFGAPANPQLLPLDPANSPLPDHSTELAGISALPWVRQTFAPRGVEPSLPARSVIEHPLALPIDGSGPQHPRRKTSFGTQGLTCAARLQPLPPMIGASAAPVVAAATAIDAAGAPAIPSLIARGRLRLPIAGVTVYRAVVEPARAAAPSWTPERAAVSPAPSIPGLSSKYRMPVQARGNVLAVAAPAARQTSRIPAEIESINPSRQPSAPSLRLAPAQGGHIAGRMRCLALTAPRAAIAAWTGRVVEWISEPEMALLPGTLCAAGARTLGQPSAILFCVPNSQPLPKAGANTPVALPMSDWGSKPLMRPANLRASDGTDFEESSASGWRTMLSEKFGKFGSLPSFGRLRRLPPDIKWIAMAIPLVIGIWVVARPEGKASSAPVQVSGGVPQAEVEPVPAPPGVEEVAAVAAEPEPPGLKKQKEVRPEPARAAEPSRFDVLQAKIAERAAVDIVEDFRSGLSRWDGKGNWARTWSYDRSGTVRPGNMAIFEPTAGLRDYNFEMKAAVDKRVIQWLVRATDLSNYHINRLIVTPDAAQTKLELQRWTVHKGRAGRVKLVPLPHGPANQTLFSVRVDVRGDAVTTYLGEQVIDTFSDSRLVSGGVGLAGAPGDQARVYAVRVSHQTDFLGKLCSFLAPQPMNMQGTE